MAVSAPDPGVRAGELFEAHGRMVYALCRMILRDSVEAEDAAQATFLSAYRSLLNGRGPEQPEAWLATIARNECTNRIARRPPSSLELLEGDGVGSPDPAGLMDSRAEFEALCAAVAELPTKQREAIVLREFYGLSYREVAAALGTTGTAVESAIFKSRRSLQERLRPMRDAAGSLALPLSLQDSLAQLIPGFSQAAAGGTGVALVAKLSVPFGVKALVAGLSVVAVGGTLATTQPAQHGKSLAARAPLHALATQPAEAATPRVAAAPRVVHTAPVVHARHPAAKAAAPQASQHQFSPPSQDDHADEAQQSDRAEPVERRDSDSGSSSHSGSGRGPTSVGDRHDDSGDGDSQEADDSGGDGSGDSGEDDSTDD
jgi:RNA polymerase sigma factor (sigma-70 family)